MSPTHMRHRTPSSPIESHQSHLLPACKSTVRDRPISFFTKTIPRRPFWYGVALFSVALFTLFLAISALLPDSFLLSSDNVQAPPPAKHNLWSHLFHRPIAQVTRHIAPETETENWDAFFQAAFGQEMSQCASQTPLPYPEPERIARTALVSFPRSGNTLTRSLVEATTHFQTSSLYCDTKLRHHFIGECDHKNPFLLKTHYPVNALRRYNSSQTHWCSFDRFLYVTRNPWDAIWSYFHFRRSEGNHTARIEHITTLQWRHRRDVMWFIKKYKLHAAYWAAVPLPSHHMRYEDLRGDTFVTFLPALRFLMDDPTRRPSVPQILCGIQQTEAASTEAYASRKHDTFYAYDKFTMALKKLILTELEEYICRFGYAYMLEQHLAGKPQYAQDPRPNCQKRETSTTFAIVEEGRDMVVVQ